MEQSFWVKGNCVVPSGFLFAVRCEAATCMPSRVISPFADTLPCSITASGSHAVNRATLKRIAVPCIVISVANQRGHYRATHLCWVESWANVKQTAGWASGNGGEACSSQTTHRTGMQLRGNLPQQVPRPALLHGVQNGCQGARSPAAVSQGVEKPPKGQRSRGLFSLE